MPPNHESNPTPPVRYRSRADCPVCHTTMTRIRRTPLMRLLPGSKRFHCVDCGKSYLRFMGKLY